MADTDNNFIHLTPLLPALDSAVKAVMGLAVYILVLLGCLRAVASQGGTEEEAQEWADEYNVQAMVENFNYVEASWNYNTNMTDHNLDISVGAV